MTAKVSRATRRPGRCNRFRRSLPIVARIFRGSGRLSAGRSVRALPPCPIADAVIASGCNSSTTTLPPTSGRRTRCCVQGWAAIGRRPPPRPVRVGDAGTAAGAGAACAAKVTIRPRPRHRSGRLADSPPLPLPVPGATDRVPPSGCVQGWAAIGRRPPPRPVRAGRFRHWQLGRTCGWAGSGTRPKKSPCASAEASFSTQGKY